MTELAARNGTERAEALLRLTIRLTELVRGETRMFQRRRPQDAVTLQDEKSKLANIYRSEVARARSEPTRFAGAPAPLKNTLREATVSFHAALAENARAVTAMKVITEGVVRAIAEEAERQRSTGHGYGPGAAQRPQQSRGLSIALNQTA
ncbi:flagellar basal-body protein FlbY [Maricaulis sp.]|uniref:flagellar basal-body protein FlbY n=1 Tax=Maricaulis sp. TaxID=1486257 RepID=UPI003A955972